jgi:hypothetical protein
VERKKHIPVRLSKQTPGLIIGVYRKMVPAPLWVNLELKPCLAWKLHFRPPPSRFDPPPPEDPADEEFVEVHLQGVRFERLRDFGEVWRTWGLWRLLGLDTL